MNDKHHKLSRRDFLKLTGMAAGAFLLPANRFSPQTPSPFPADGALLGRMADGDVGAFREIYSEPNISAPIVRRIYRDEVFDYQQEVIASSFDLNN